MKLWGGVLAALCGLALLSVAPASAGTLPANFRESTVFSGLTYPTQVRFASDGRVFVAEKSGLIKVYASLTSTTPTVFYDLRSQVDDYWDRGLLGLALDPNFPASPYVYALFTYDAPIGGLPPVWNDDCPSPPGPTTDGCVVSGRLVAPDRQRKRGSETSCLCSAAGASSTRAIRSAIFASGPMGRST